MNNKCAECGCVDFEIKVEADEFQRNGQPFIVDMEYSICYQCNDEVIFSEQIKHNDCILRDTWRKIDGLLTAQEIVALREKLKLTQQDAAKVFGGGVNAFSKYERSEVTQSGAMDKSMRGALAISEYFSWLKQQAGLTNSNYDDNVFPITSRIKEKVQPNTLKILVSEDSDYYEERANG